jgi:hypothetical protein
MDTVAVTCGRRADLCQIYLLGFVFSQGQRGLRNGVEQKRERERALALPVQSYEAKTTYKHHPRKG